MITVAPDIILTLDKRKEEKARGKMAQLSQLPFKSFLRVPSSNFHLLDCPKSSFFLVRWL